ncbi:MAG: response regulator [Phycisphaerales bacterium]
MNDYTATRVLIIDNDEGLAEALTIRLESEGFSCISANSGAQGLAVFENSTVDVVLTDMNMPGGNGIVVIENIRKTSSVPILVMTGFESEFAEQFEGIEGISVVSKPFNIETLIDEIEISVSLADSM